MKNDSLIYDAVVIGGGFYGSVIALHLAKNKEFRRVLIIEREGALLSRASSVNQARIHNGYHYPRSFTTAYRSRVSSPKFISSWPEAIVKNFTKLYAIAKSNSKVTANQFEKFSHQIGASIREASPSNKALFNSRLIENVFEVEEYVFDSKILTSLIQEDIEKYEIEVMLNTMVNFIGLKNNQLFLVVTDSKNNTFEILSRYLFNCTYSGLNHIQYESSFNKTNLKHEITEMALVRPPSGLNDLAITVMDGPFFSFMPFPSMGLYTLSHVRYTPHLSWSDHTGQDPYQILNNYHKHSRFERMIRDSSRFVPSLIKAEYIKSIFEVKTILMASECDDSGPILFEKIQNLSNCISVLGGKIDNIYDVLTMIDNELF